MLSIIDFLKEREIPYRTEGKNTTRGWVEISCPFCADPSMHCGISPQLLFSCWACGNRGSLAILIQKLDGCPYSEAHTIANSLIPNQEEFNYIPPTIVSLPQGVTKIFPGIHRKYLRDRGYNPQYLIDKYNLYACHNTGPWKFRIIIPILINKQLVAYTARAVSEELKIKYKHVGNDYAIIPVKSCLYGIDSIKTEKAIVVEGVFDVWRIGDGTVCTFGTQFTHEQIFRLSQKNLRDIVIIFDHEDKAISQAYKLANILSLYIPRVEVWELEKGDPDIMNEKELKEVKEWLTK